MEWFWIALASAFLSTAATVTEKKILFSLSAYEFSFLLSLVTLLFSVWIPFSFPFNTFTFSLFLFLTIKSLVGAAAFLLVMMALEKNEISSALPLLGVTPAVTAFIAFFFLGEGLLPQEWIGIGLMIVGTFIIEKRAGINLWKSIQASHTQLVIAGAVLLFALSSVADRLLLTQLHVHPQIVLFFQHVLYAVLFGILLLLKRKPWKMLWKNRQVELVLILVVAIFTFAYRYAQLEATKLAPVALVLAVKRTSIFFASFIGGKFFAEKRLAIKLVGALCIVAGGFFILRHIS